MKPFNLERALAGAKVITRDGKPVPMPIVFETKDGKILAQLFPATKINTTPPTK